MKTVIIVYAISAFVVAVMLTATIPVEAQQLDQPKTIKLQNKATGEPLGTITISGATAYYRNKDGEHYATGVRNPDGGMIFFDPSGNIIGPIKTPE